MIRYLLLSLLLVGCAGGPKPTPGSRVNPRPADPIYPGLEEALAQAGIDSRGPLLNTEVLDARSPSLFTSGLGWYGGLSRDAMLGPRFGADLVKELDRSVAAEQPVSQALQVILGLSGMAVTSPRAAPAVGKVEIPDKVPAQLREALGPILTALVAVKEADVGTPRMLRAAIKLAQAVEGARLSRFVGLKVDAWWYVPGLGKVILAGPGDDVHSYAKPRSLGASVALLLDTGGADTYRMPAGANTPGESLASVHIDLGGDDKYEAAVAGQGSGQRGVGLLWDLGGGADAYHTAGAGQGAGANGVGVLFDDGGNDKYTGVRGAQGAGMDGVGILLDLGGDDQYETFTRSQGFGGPGGHGVLYDRAGNDKYRADPGDPKQGGVLRFPSPQLPHGGNASLSQGAAAGLRDDKGGQHRVGGVGLLRDRAGDDSYEAGVFAQGAGYWFAAGYLFDDAGNDQYDALWYAQGAAAHFALGLMRDGGGDDRYNLRLKPVSSSLGLGHDLAAGWHLDLGGNDQYRAPPLSLGQASSDGAGILYNLGGQDAYQGANPSAGDGASWGDDKGVGIDTP